MRSIILLISLFVTANVYAKPWVAIGTGCNDGKRAYDTQAQCEAGETGPGSCEDYGAKVAACKQAIIDKRAALEAAMESRRTKMQNALDNWDTLTNAQKDAILKRIVQHLLNAESDG